MFVVDNKRITTMRKHLGKASELIKDDAYLPMFRNRQKKYKQEFDESVEVAKTKRYLASVWSLKNLEQSLLWMRDRIARAINELTRQRQEKKQRKMEEKVRRDMNYSGRAKMLQMYNDMGICLKS